MKETVDYLCSPACLPRNPGTDGGIAARTYLRARLESLGLEPIGEKGFDQALPSIGGSNLLGVIRGTRDRYVLLAAHYDACGPDNPGADDNAAAVAVVLDVAERLQDMKLDRSVIIAFFDAEEDAPRDPFNAFLSTHEGSDPEGEEAFRAFLGRLLCSMLRNTGAVTSRESTRRAAAGSAATACP